MGEELAAGGRGLLWLPPLWHHSDRVPLGDGGQVARGIWGPEWGTVQAQGGQEVPGQGTLARPQGAVGNWGPAGGQPWIFWAGDGVKEIAGVRGQGGYAQAPARPWFWGHKGLGHSQEGAGSWGGRLWVRTPGFCEGRGVPWGLLGQDGGGQAVCRGFNVSESPGERREGL